jgi:hypothetical protein
MNLFKFLLSPALVCAFSLPVNGQLTINGFSGLTTTLSPAGVFLVNIPGPRWQFLGTLGNQPFNSRIGTGTDNLGPYQELAFDYSIGKSNRSGSIRTYAGRPLVLFAVTYNNASANSSPFPLFNSQPGNLFELSFNGVFAFRQFGSLLPDSPSIYFDAAANTFIVSAASDYMVASGTGISSQIATLPAGLTHRTALAFGQGINETFEAWGGALTDLTGKHRPANDADALLKSISYWTDNGATYYYNPGGPSYTDTLKAIKAEFNTKGIALGSMQLDSWWYPKGPDDAWSSHGGIWTYTAATPIFQPDLASFRASLGVPLAAHARWIDAGSPYRSQYLISGDVATDPQYWEDTAAYLAASGVSTYEQDWLASNAQTAFNLSDPAAFLDNMAASMQKRGITMQYCMATPRHFLQSTKYGNITTIRTSQDGFGPARWTEFLYSSRLASALGIWPFSDVFMSNDLNNLILATLSAGPVGIGDTLGSISQANLLKAVRSDGVIVKPDVPATPVDSVFVSDAQGIDTPMIASTWSNFGGSRTNYIFAYSRGANTAITIQPSSWGITGAAYLYDYLDGIGYPIGANSEKTLMLNGGVGYFILAAVGETGIAFLGDQGDFVTMGKNRIPLFVDTGRINLLVAYGSGEQTRTLFGYSPKPVNVTAVNGSADNLSWSSSTQLFTVNVHPSSAGTAHVSITQTAAARRQPAAVTAASLENIPK